MIPAALLCLRFAHLPRTVSPPSISPSWMIFFGVSLHGRCFSAPSQWHNDMFLFNGGEASIHTVHLHFYACFSCLSAFATLDIIDSHWGEKVSLCLRNAAILASSIFFCQLSPQQELNEKLDAIYHQCKCVDAHRSIFQAIGDTFGKQDNLFSCRELHVQIDTTLLLASPMWSWSQQLLA